MTEELEAIYGSLFSEKKLERDHGVSQLGVFLSSVDAETLHSLQKTLLDALGDADRAWEAKHGALLASKVLLKSLGVDNRSRFYLDTLYDACLSFLTYYEVRIRLAAGEVLGGLCHLEGPKIYEQTRDSLLELIRDNLERDICPDVSDSHDPAEEEEDDKLQKSPRRNSCDAAQIFHDTAGWKFLETSMKCLQFMVDGCGESFKAYISNDFLELLFKTLSHTNRFVRETGYYVMASLVACATSCEDTPYNPFSAENFGHQISKQLGIGLSDNWSQVRLASSECARKFLLSFKSDEEREVFFSQLLPRMCLNRYYIADGVRIYSQESWRKIVVDNGRKLVKIYIKDFVEYYIAQTKANNHAVREAACACIAELASKVDQESTRPYVPQLLQTLLDCFADDSWPVRDAACLACGNFVLCFPNESRCVLDKLLPMFYANLKDCIPSVRQGASGALSNVVRAYGLEVFQSMKPQILDGLKGVEKQSSDSEKYSQLEKGPATFGVIKRLRDNDMELHTDKQMYSCGSLAPKMGRSGGGCGNYKFRKPPEPWEFADGCIHLVAELTQVKGVVGQVCELLPEVREAMSHRHYTHHVCLLESLCKQLPNMCDGLGKRLFKQYLELFLDDVFYSLECENHLTSAAASQCLVSLSKALGPNVLRGRVENFNPKYLNLLDSHVPQAL